jgi:hypothetical protein
MGYKKKTNPAKEVAAFCTTKSKLLGQQNFLLWLDTCGYHMMMDIIHLIIIQQPPSPDQWPAHRFMATAGLFACLCRSAKGHAQAVKAHTAMTNEFKEEKERMATTQAWWCAENEKKADAKRASLEAKKRAEDAVHRGRVEKVESRWVYHRHDVGSAREGTEFVYVARCERSG